MAASDKEIQQNFDLALVDFVDLFKDYLNQITPVQGLVLGQIGLYNQLRLAHQAQATIDKLQKEGNDKANNSH